LGWLAPSRGRTESISPFAKTSYSRLLDLIAILAELLWLLSLLWFMRFVEIQSLIRYFFLSRLSLFVSPLMKGRRWNIQGILTVPSFRFKSIEVFAVVRTLVKITQGSSHPNFQGSPIFRGPLLLVSGRIGLRGYRTRGAIPRL